MSRTFFQALFIALFSALIGVSCQSDNAKEDAVGDTAVAMEFPVATDSEEAREAFSKGVELLSYPDNSKARAYFTQAIEADPGFAGAYLYRNLTAGSAAEGVPDLEKANENLKGATEGEKLMAEWMTTWTTGDQEKALSIAQQMVEKYPDLPRAHLILGNIYAGRNETELSRTAFQKAIEVAPNSFIAHRRLGVSYLFDEPKDFDKAIAQFQKLIEIDAENPSAYTRLGDGYRAKNDLDKALEYYQTAAEKAPDNFLAYQLMGHANSFLGNMEEARNNYKVSAEKNANGKANAMRYAALTYVYEGDPAKAIQELRAMNEQMEEMGVPVELRNQRKLANLDASNVVAFHNNLAEELKAGVEMTKPVDMALASDVGTEEANKNAEARKWMREGLAAVAEGDLETAKAKAEAHRTIRESFNFSARFDQYYFLMGQIALKEGDAQKAIEQLEKLPKGGWVYGKYSLAKAYEMADREEEALGIYKELATYNFNDTQYAVIRNEVVEKLKAF
jgi:tetratricopeptide (TPR) repeat protein